MVGRLPVQRQVLASRDGDMSWTKWVSASASAISSTRADPEGASKTGRCGGGAYGSGRLAQPHRNPIPAPHTVSQGKRAITFNTIADGDAGLCWPIVGSEGT